ncbi:hypothetical protein GCM10020000_75640 [Streptomyces olivoverticillatus]
MTGAVGAAGLMGGVTGAAAGTGAVGAGCVRGAVSSGRSEILRSRVIGEFSMVSGVADFRGTARAPRRVRAGAGRRAAGGWAEAVAGGLGLS